MSERVYTDEELQGLLVATEALKRLAKAIQGVAAFAPNMAAEMLSACRGGDRSPWLDEAVSVMCFDGLDARRDHAASALAKAFPGYETQLRGYVEREVRRIADEGRQRRKRRALPESGVNV